MKSLKKIFLCAIGLISFLSSSMILHADCCVAKGELTQSSNSTCSADKPCSKCVDSCDGCKYTYCQGLVCNGNYVGDVLADQKGLVVAPGSSDAGTGSIVCPNSVCASGSHAATDHVCGWASTKTLQSWCRKTVCGNATNGY